MSVTWITHKGKRILFNDSSNQASDGIIKMIEEEARFVAGAPGRVLILDDYTNCVADSRAMERTKQLGRDIIEPKTEKVALLGITGIKAVLLSAYNWFTGAGARQRLFRTADEAKDWLVQ